MARQQQGYIFRKGRNWYGRWWDDVIVEGQIVRKQRCEKLAEVSDRYRSRADVRVLLAEKLRPINAGKMRPESTLNVSEYADDFWLPWVRENLKPSTVDCYQKMWRTLAPHLNEISLRDFRTVDAANLLAELHQRHKFGRTMLKHIKALLSGIFSFAKNQGVLDGVNPLQDAMLPKKAVGPEETHAATPDEVLAILDAIENAQLADREIDTISRLKAQAAVALCYFSGLRPGEARGVQWSDFDGKRLMIRRSVWGTHVTAPKTVGSVKPVPVIEPLRVLLSELCEADGNPADGHILRGPSGKPLNLANVARRVVIPLLKAKKLEWHGWYQFRRGVATAIAGLSKDPLAAKGLLRHASLATTDRHYLKNVPENTLAAMNQLEELCNSRAIVQAAKPS
ncbi:MAG TPA: tyrosine-type recombinase/integrase [Candidatus Acidoferrum sp.]|nr:tyrosine-type recombinase/integrase [Candidatus Acidoferrum sp.]